MDMLIAVGHEVTSSWVDSAEALGGVELMGDRYVAERRAGALNCLTDIAGSDAIIVLVPECGGTGLWLELGYAMALEKQLLAVGPAQRRTIFAELCHCHDTAADAVAALTRIQLDL
jgi:nucleoside 2-deoxyribosyltransferase